MYTEGLIIAHHTQNTGKSTPTGLSTMPNSDCGEFICSWYTKRGFDVSSNFFVDYDVNSNAVNGADIKSLSDETRIAEELESLLKKGYEVELMDGTSDSLQYYQAYFDRKKNCIIFGGAVMIAAYIGRYGLVEKLLDAGFPVVQRLKFASPHVTQFSGWGGPPPSPLDALRSDAYNTKIGVVADHCFFAKKTDAGMHISNNTTIGVDYVVYTKNDMPDDLALRILDDESNHFNCDSLEPALYDGADPARLINLMCHTKRSQLRNNSETAARTTLLKGILIPEINPFTTSSAPFSPGPEKVDKTEEEKVITGLWKKAYNRYLRFQQLYIDHLFEEQSVAEVKKFIINMNLYFDSVPPLHGTTNTRALLEQMNSHFSQRKQLLKAHHDGPAGEELWMTCFYEIPYIDTLTEMVKVRSKNNDPNLEKTKKLMEKYTDELAAMRPDTVTGPKLYRRWRSKFHDKFNCHVEAFDTNDAWGFVKKKLGVEMETKLDVDTIRYLSSYTSQLADELRRPEEDDDRMPFLVDMSIQNAHKHLRRHIDNLCSIKVTYEDPLEKKTAKKDYMKLLDNLIDIGDEDLVEAYYRKGVITQREFDTIINRSMELDKRELVPFLMANMD